MNTHSIILCDLTGLPAEKLSIGKKLMKLKTSDKTATVCTAVVETVH